jgi:hypothetical protein
VTLAWRREDKGLSSGVTFTFAASAANWSQEKDRDDGSGHYYFAEAGSAKSRSFADSKRLFACANLARFRTCARRLRKRFCVAQSG